MPNHVFNRIRIQANEARSKEILAAIQNDEAGPGSIDFNKIIPMPPELDIECGSRTMDALKLYKEYITEVSARPSNGRKTAEIRSKYEARYPDEPDMLTLGEQVYTNIQKYGHDTWYSWSIANWGTKWNAFDYDLDSLRRDGSIVFSTAWSGVPQVMETLSRQFPDAVFAYEWADEDVGYNLGQISFKDGHAISIDIPQDQSREAFEMYQSITGESLEDLGFAYKESEGTYVWEDADEPAAIANTDLSMKPKYKQAER